MVFQHFMLADNLTVLENVVLGAEKLHGIGGDARAEVQRISDAYGLDIEPDRLVEELGVGARQRVEILKVLYRGARIIILDEPTAVLVPQEVDELFGNLRELKKEGLSVIFISHKLDEVLAVADEITVIRRGTTVRTVLPSRGHRPPARRADGRLRAALAEHRDLDGHRDGAALGPRTSRLPAPGGRPLLDDITFDIHKGEVLGIAGVEGNGQAELVESIMGMRPALDRHDRALRQGPAPRSRPGSAARPASATSPRTGTGTGCCSTPRCGRTACSVTRAGRPSAKGPLIDKRGARADTERIIKEYDVRTPGPNVLARALSGGNQQKLIVGREMSGEPILLIAAHPTRGVDVGAQAAIWGHIKTARRNGLAVLLISADLDELIGLSDTHRGHPARPARRHLRPGRRDPGAARLGR